MIAGVCHLQARALVGVRVCSFFGVYVCVCACVLPVCLVVVGAEDCAQGPRNEANDYVTKHPARTLSYLPSHTQAFR